MKKRQSKPASSESREADKGAALQRGSHQAARLLPQPHHVPEKGLPIRHALYDAVQPVSQGYLIETHDSLSS